MFEFEVTERQIHLLIDSLDMYSRIWMGQFCRLREYLWMYRRLCHDSTFEACVEDLMFAVRALFNPKAAEVGHFGSLGIWSPEICELAVSAYDMQQVIRHEYSWFVHPEGDIGVSFDDPHLRGFLPVPQATCHTLENGEVGMSISMEEEPPQHPARCPACPQGPLEPAYDRCHVPLYDRQSRAHRHPLRR